MANLAILASGSGTNFEKIYDFFLNHPTHSIVLLICDRKDAGVFEKAKDRNLEAHYLPYFQRDKEQVEADLSKILKEKSVDLVVLAGFMRVLGKSFVNEWQGRVVNIHPSLLPKHKGVQGILESYQSGDREMGITIHWVDEGVDTGKIIRQQQFSRTKDMTLEEAEKKIHELEHQMYPQVILELCKNLTKKG